MTFWTFLGLAALFSAGFIVGFAVCALLAAGAISQLKEDYSR